MNLSQRKAGEPSNRQKAHLKAWNAPQRGDRHGQKFKLDDAVMWMRLIFWSCREEGLAEDPFFSWFIDFIRHFVKVYERAAANVAWSAADWSGSAVNTSKYEEDGWL